ncbi:serine protease [Aureimonas sp. Leaf454]|uniref:DegQ family serine endoprotease n=1 Tax=Aureimonas sp. Leaf454 TaxID=1736381 RepID=UPI0006F8759B|nr:DegQ family serine endoprotease [Aureimonas sp. Leaf454]KQT48667.1 serine protease [Aureimonas sp. Leaf454]
MLRTRKLIGAAGACLLVAVPLAVPLAFVTAGASSAQTAATAPIPVAPAAYPDGVPASASEIKLSFAPLVKTSAPAVVNVYAARKLVARSPFQGDPFFEQFFGQRLQQRPRIESSLGSGVIVDATGLIVTNNHVIKDADEVKVALADGREFPSRILMKDERADLAVLKIDSTEAFPALPLADSDEIEIGDLVLAIGNPFGIGQTVTNGIVSALARTHIGVNDFGYFIQTDAPINPGNSGGALIDMRGELVGVNTAIYSRSGGSNGIGFAIPSNMVRVFVDAARNGGRFERPFIGATFAQVTPDIAEAVGLDRPAGSLVESLYSGGPADAAGLEAGDVVLAIDGFAIGNPDTLGYRLATAGIGKSVALDVNRNGETKSLQLALAAPPETPARDVRRIAGETPFSGATVANLSPRMADELDMTQTLTGVVVTGVGPRSFAGRFGLQPKDIVVTVNGRAVRTTADLERLAADGRRGWVIEVERDGKRLTQRVR